MTTVAETLAEFVMRTRSVPASALNSAHRALLDLMTAAVAGRETAGARAARLGAAAAWGAGRSTIWFSGEGLTMPGAAFANAAMACQLDLDDGHRAAAGHPGASIIPAVLATAEATGASGEAILTAITLGYEVAVRISASRDLQKIPTTDSGIWCGPGAVAAAGWLRQSPRDALAHAFAISGTTGPSQSATPYTRIMGNHVKEGIPMATAGGLTALELALCGFTGPLDMFDAGEIYSREALLGGLGESWHVEGVYFKPYSACRWAHAPVDALVQLMQEHHLAGADIEAVEVETFGRALTLNNEIRPHSLESAQYSIPFCLGIAACGGTGALLPLTEAALRDEKAIAIAEKVQLRVDPVLDAMFSKAVPARVTVRVGGRSFTAEVLAPKGEPSNPLTDADLEDKLRFVVEPEIGARWADAMIRAVHDTAAGYPEGLLRLLGNPIPMSPRDGGPGQFELDATSPNNGARRSETASRHEPRGA